MEPLLLISSEALYFGQNHKLQTSTLLLFNVYSDFWGSVFENFFEVLFAISTLWQAHLRCGLSSIENDIFCLYWKCAEMQQLKVSRSRNKIVEL